MSKCLIALSVSVINVLMNCYGFFSIAYLHPKFNVFIFVIIKIYVCQVYQSCMECVFCCFFVIVIVSLCFCSAPSFFIEIAVCGVHYFV
jgi:hypothetical protein